MKKQVSIFIDPVISLRELKKFIDPPVLKYEGLIDSILAEQYSHLINEEREVVVSGMNADVRGRSELHQIPFGTLFKEYGDKRDLLAQVPYLLGLVKHQSFLRRYQDIQSIEVFENKPEGLFKGAFGRPSYLCLRRVGTGYVVAISTYVHKGVINAEAAVSPNCIKVLSFPDKVVDKTYLSEKMIC